MHGKESALRKLEAENESLAFRNGQLLKRVEALQAEIDRAQQSPSGKVSFLIRLRFYCFDLRLVPTGM